MVQERLRGNSYYRSGLFYRAFEGMNPYLGEGEWIFNSLFESGNLDCAIKVGESEFDLFLRVDSNTKGHTQWFYFSVKNGLRKQKLKMNICNLSKAKSLFDAVNVLEYRDFSHMSFRVGYIELMGLVGDREGIILESQNGLYVMTIYKTSFLPIYWPFIVYS